MSEQSESINELATALAKAQGKITGALKDSANPFFKSKYADLASCWEACREALSINGLSIVQTTGQGNPVIIKWSTTDQSSGEVTDYAVETKEIIITTMLLHSSGQFIRSHLFMIPRDVTPQGLGSVITYGRRYGLAAIIGVAQVDDDGNAASGRGIDPRGEPKNKQATPETVKRMVSRIADMKALDLDEFGHAAKAFEIHEELNQDQDLYIAVADEMAKQGIFSKKNWKDLLNLHKVKMSGPGARATN